MFRKKKSIILFAVLCLCIGGTFFWKSAAAQTERVSAAEKITEDEFRDVIITAYQNYQTVVLVEEYGLYSDTDAAMVASVMEDVLNKEYSLFYIGRGYKKILLSDTKQLMEIHLTYAAEYMTGDKVDREKIEATLQRLDAATDEALGMITDEMTAVEKAMLLHDYLISKVVYSDDISYANRLTIAGALLENCANCQGYSLTYQMLLEKAGIRAECVISRKMNHMWNLVKIGSKWYHTDLTWDDPLRESDLQEQYGVVVHQNFLLSDRGIEATGHYGFEEGVAKDTTYDNAWWQEISSSFYYQSGKFVYADTKGIYTRRCLTSGKAKRIKKIAAKCFVRASENEYYFISGDKIYRFMFKNKKLKKVYKVPAGSTLLELKYQDNTLYCRYQKGDTTKLLQWYI